MKRTKLAALLAALALAACSGQPNEGVGLPAPPRFGLLQGIDIPTDSSDVLSELRTSRLDFVARYYREPTSRWPALTASEVQRLSSLGLKVVVVWESHSHKPEYFTYATGYSDGWNAYRQAKGVGQPPGSAIYFAVDFNAQAQHLWYVDQYFRGVNAGLAAAGRGRPEYWVGVYGSGSVCAMLKGSGLARYSWLSNSRAWNGTAGYSGWNIRQTGRFPNLTFNHDSNEAREDYGGFRSTAYGAAAPPPAPAPAPRAAATAPSPPPAERSFASIIGSWF